MILKRGDVVIVQFPFSSGTNSKIRPALVVQNDQNNSRLTNVIVAAITTTTFRNQSRTQLFVDVESENGRKTGLLRDSVVTCENLATIDQSLVSRKIGQMPPDLMLEVESCLKVALGLN